MKYKKYLTSVFQSCKEKTSSRQTFKIFVLMLIESSGWVFDHLSMNCKNVLNYPHPCRWGVAIMMKVAEMPFNDFDRSNFHFFLFGSDLIKYKSVLHYLLTCVCNFFPNKQILNNHF